MMRAIASYLYRRITLVAVCGVAIAAVLLTPTAEAASAAPEITVYRDPSCSCCGGWIDYLAAQGFQPTNIPTPNVDALKQQYGVPEDLTSCHTAIVNGYVIEGHVPVDDIKRLLAEQPNVAGITVPGMPVGTPGMESGDEREPFTVFSFDQQGNTEIFNQYL
jgi:hypothetical protein